MSDQPQWLRVALYELLEVHIDEHMDRGAALGEALVLSAQEIMWLIRGSRGDLIKMLIDDAVLQARFARENATKH